MTINSLQGTTAYTNPPGTTPPVDKTQLSDQNLEAPRTDLNTENTNAAPTAFTVSITEEAQDRLAAQTAEEPVEAQTTTLEDQTAQNTGPDSENSQIVNIVA